jgi:hypothetical protein
VREVEVLGFLPEVVPPIEGGFLELPQGVTVLYGRNGVGKTRLLKALMACLGAGASTDDCSILVRTPMSGDDAPLVMSYAQAWANYEETEWTPSSLPRDLAVDVDIPLLRAVLDNIDTFESLMTEAEHGPSIEMTELAKQIVAQRLFLVSPDVPGSWTVTIAAKPDEDAPLVDALMARVRQASESQSDILRGLQVWDPVGGATWFDPDGYPLLALEDASKGLGDFDLCDLVIDPHPEQVADPRELLRQFQRHGIQLTNKRRMSQQGEDLLKAVETLSQRLLNSVLMDAPRLRLRVGHPRDWLLGAAPLWEVADSRGRWLPLSALSRAQHRWAHTAIAVAGIVVVRETSKSSASAWMRARDVPLFIVLDEPEAALHRSAETHMAQGLASWAEDLDAHIVVASHSPELLDLDSAHLSYVGPSPEGGSTIAAMPAATHETMELLGLLPSDLLRRQRCCLLVEGRHEELILNVLIGEELRRLGVAIISLRGGSKLPDVVNSQFLFHFTDAHVVPMLDALRAEQLESLWEEALIMRSKASPEIAGNHLRRNLPGQGPEAKWMSEFLSAALLRGLDSRITPFGLAEGDVIEYLPVAKLVRGASSWSDLRQRHPGADFKGQLKKAYGASFTDAKIEAAAMSLDSLPVEITRLMSVCDAVTQRTRQRDGS